MILIKNSSIKICVSSSKESLEAEIDPRFGRCEYFVIVDIKDSKISDTKAIKNIGYTKDSGAGISAAEQIGKLGVDILITGDVGPKAKDVLEQLEIKVCKKSGIARAAISEYLNDSIVQSSKTVLSEDSGTQKDAQIIKNQRIFIPLMDDNGKASEISLHFGHAPYFGLYDFLTGKLAIEKNKLDHSSQEKSPVDQVIEQVNPTLVYAQDMGGRAINLFTEKNILLKTGPYKTAGEVMDNIDKLEDLSKSCSH